MRQDLVKFGVWGKLFWAGVNFSVIFCLVFWYCFCPFRLGFVGFSSFEFCDFGFLMLVSLACVMVGARKYSDRFRVSGGNCWLGGFLELEGFSFGLTSAWLVWVSGLRILVCCFACSLLTWGDFGGCSVLCESEILAILGFRLIFLVGGFSRIWCFSVLDLVSSCFWLKFACLCIL